MRSTVINVFVVCSSVCLFVCRIAYLKKPHVHISRNFLYMLRRPIPVAVARSSSDGSVILCTSGFMDCVMFPYIGRNRPEFITTRMFSAVGQVAAPGARSAVSDCILLLLNMKLMIQ